MIHDASIPPVWSQRSALSSAARRETTESSPTAVLARPDASLGDASASSADRLDYRIRVLDSLAALEAQKAEWDAFHTQVDPLNPFVDRVWMTTLLKHFPPQRLCLVVVTDAAGEWLAVAPWLIARDRIGGPRRALRTLRFIGTDPAVNEQSRLLRRPDVPVAELAEVLARWLLKDAPGWDVLSLEDCGDGAFLEALAAQMSARGLSATQTRRDGVPVMTLPTSAEAYERDLRRRLRRALLNARNRVKTDLGLERPVFRFRIQPADVVADFERLCVRHQDYWQARGIRSDFVRYPGLESMFADMIHQPQPHQVMWLAQIELPEGVPAMAAGIWRRHPASGESMFYFSLINYDPAFERYRPGLLMTDDLIRQTIALGAKVFSFGRGEQEYKSFWTDTVTPLWSLTVMRSPWARGVMALEARLQDWRVRRRDQAQATPDTHGT